ncbi:outer membrane autotransporter barrel domain-containing protein [Striga asiatica]|uniref:Outer membrane autotransporter barrel domain-containing protein n=1 Tax=Striga asiatica TaxID=4170 RepID=A0A5A7QLW8_STRAF|nr:outer membrane autotransporter barrel domain-containing protein [Striga asiatica]
MANSFENNVRPKEEVEGLEPLIREFAKVLHTKFFESPLPFFSYMQIHTSLTSSRRGKRRIRRKSKPSSLVLIACRGLDPIGIAESMLEPEEEELFRRSRIAFAEPIDTWAESTQA